MHTSRLPCFRHRLQGSRGAGRGAATHMQGGQDGEDAAGCPGGTRHTPASHGPAPLPSGPGERENR